MGGLGAKEQRVKTGPGRLGRPQGTGGAGSISLPTTQTDFVTGKYKQVSSKPGVTLSPAIKLALPRPSSAGDSPRPSVQRRGKGPWEGLAGLLGLDSPLPSAPLGDQTSHLAISGELGPHNGFAPTLEPS